ncbi:MAG: ABC transporter ATP-binding protein [Lachnospiraceae bacterium]|nr:ABC transporter ATP-binding protein [Lachnospiraceae bacterium]
MRKGEENCEQKYVKYYKKYSNRPLMVLLGFYKGQYHKFFISSFFFLIKHSPALFSSLLIANVINGVIAGGEAARQAIIINVGIWIGLLLIHLPANYLHSMYRSRVTRATEAGLRAALVRKLQELSIPYHTKLQSGRLQSKIIRDVEAVETLSSQLFISVINILMNITIMLTITAVKNRTILLFILLVAPIASFTVIAFRKKISKVNRAFRKEMEETSVRVMEMVEMVPVTRAHALEDVEKDRMSRQLEQTAESGYRLDMVQSNFGAVGWVVFQIFQALCLAFTGYLALNGKIQVGDITFYQTGFTTVVNQFTAFINLLPIMTKGLESVTSIGEILSSNDVEHNEGKEELDGLRGEYSFENVKYAYPGAETNVLNGLSVKVRKGETIAVVGGSGAGKSTLLNLIIGFMFPADGIIRVDGRRIDEINLKSYRKYISVVPQMPLLFTGTLRNNIIYGLEDVSEERFEQAIEAANLKQLIDSLPDGADTMIDEHGGNLSGGQRQRIAIARAIIRDPRVIILDEATSALDVISEKEIQEALSRLVANRTTFIVAHRLSTVKNADRILVLSEGRIAESGSYGELMEKRGMFYHMENLQTSLQ